MGRKSKKAKIIDELDALGVDFEEVYEDEDGVAIEMSEQELSDLLKKEKEALTKKHNGVEEEPDLKVLPKKGGKEKEKSSSLPSGTIEISVSVEEVAKLQKEKKLIGYREKDGQRYAIVKKGA